MLADSPRTARGIVARLQRARKRLAELIARSAPEPVIALVKLNVAELQYEIAQMQLRRVQSEVIKLLPRRQAA